MRLKNQKNKTDFMVYEMAAKDVSAVIESLKNIGITAISAHIKIISKYAVKILVTVSDSDFVKESFSDIYPSVASIQEKSKSEFYSVSFTFVNRSIHFDEELVRLDGFIAFSKLIGKS